MNSARSDQSRGATVRALQVADDGLEVLRQELAALAEVPR